MVFAMFRGINFEDKMDRKVLVSSKKNTKSGVNLRNFKWYYLFISIHKK